MSERAWAPGDWVTMSERGGARETKGDNDE